jgi:hypothetical protein
MVHHAFTDSTFNRPTSLKLFQLSHNSINMRSSISNFLCLFVVTLNVKKRFIAFQCPILRNDIEIVSRCVYHFIRNICMCVYVCTCIFVVLVLVFDLEYSCLRGIPYVLKFVLSLF